MIAQQISMQDLHQRLSGMGSNEIVLDVRTREEFAEGHIPRSRNIPHDEVEKHVNELRKFDRIYIHCRSGRRAQVATEALTNHGLNNLVCIGSGGMQDWLAAGYEVEKS